MATQRPHFPVAPVRRVALATPRPGAAPVMRPKAGALTPFLQVAPVAILIIGLLLPVEVRFNLAGQTLYAYRIAWMLVAPWIGYQILAGRFQARFIDLLVGCASLWIVISFAYLDGVAKGVPAGLALGLDVLVPYLVTRHTIKTVNDFRRLLVLLAPVALALALVVTLESVTHTRFIQSGARAIFGSLGEAEYGRVIKAGQIDTRFGLMRAAGPFSHPILAGVFFAGLLPLYYFSGLRGWPFFAGMAAGLGVIFSLSSAAFLGAFIFIALAAFDFAQKRTAFLSWPMFLSATGAVLLVLQILAPNGLVGVLIRYTMNPASGYYRLLIWEYGSRSVAAHPFFGIGYTPFEKLIWMTDSVDTIWLAIAIRNGLPPALLLAAAVVLVIAMLIRSASIGDPYGRQMLKGIAITLAIFFILGFTVSFFGGALIWFAMMLGVGTSLGHGFVKERRPAPAHYRRMGPGR